MAITSIESLIYEAPSKDNNSQVPNVLETLERGDQIKLLDRLDEIRVNTELPPPLNPESEDANESKKILEHLVRSRPWMDILMLTRTVGEACLNQNNSFLIEPDGEIDIERRADILSQVKFLSKGLYLLGRGHIFKIAKKAFVPKSALGLNLDYEIPQNNSVAYKMTMARPKGYASVHFIDILTRKLPERGAEARVGISVRGLAGGGIPMECGISFDQNIKSYSYSPANSNRRPKLDLRFNTPERGDLLEGLNFNLQSRSQNKGHHFYTSDRYQTGFDNIHNSFSRTLENLYKHYNTPTQLR